MVECSVWTDGYRKTSNEEISTCSSRQYKYVPSEAFPSLGTASISKASHNAVRQFILSQNGWLIRVFQMIVFRGGIMKRIQG